LLEDRLDAPEAPTRKHGGVFVFRRGAIHIDYRIGQHRGCGAAAHYRRYTYRTKLAMHDGSLLFLNTMLRQRTGGGLQPNARFDSAQIVGRAILPAAGFGRLKGGCGHDWPPNNLSRVAALGN